MNRIAAAIVLVPLMAMPAWAKTEQECEAEFTANKDKIEGGQTGDQFVAACQAGKEIVPGATSSPRPAVPPATAAQQPATPPGAAGQATKPATP